VEAEREIAPPSRRGPVTRANHGNERSGIDQRFRSRFSEPLQMSGMAGVIFRAAFDDAAHILDQIKAEHAGLFLRKSRPALPARSETSERDAAGRLASRCALILSGILQVIVGHAF